MAIEITVPRLGWSMEEGSFAGWLKQDGERVKPGDLLFALEGDKTTQEIESLDGGILRIPADAPKSGESVKVGQLLAYLVVDGESMPAPSRTSRSPRPLVTDAPTDSSRSTVESEASTAARLSTVPGAPISKSAREPDEARRRAELEFGAPAPLAGLGAAVPVTPRARRVATELGVDTAGLAGTGKGGRIRERDVRSAVEDQGEGAAAPAAEATEGIAMSARRRTIAARLLQSRQNTVPVTLTCRVDATNLVGLRQRLRADGSSDPLPSYTDIIARVVAGALQRHPMLAARWENDRFVLPKAIHIGIAVDTGRGLLVPVIRNVPELTLNELARRSRELIEAARAGRSRPEDLQGGVFTITNLGAFGIDAFTPVINFPESAILGLGAIRPQVVVLDDGQFAAREQMTLSLTFDHRVVDGAPAARFLQSVREGIEGPGLGARR